MDSEYELLLKDLKHFKESFENTFKDHLKEAELGTYKKITLPAIFGGHKRTNATIPKLPRFKALNLPKNPIIFLEKPTTALSPFQNKFNLKKLTYYKIPKNAQNARQEIAQS